MEQRNEISLTTVKEYIGGVMGNITADFDVFNGVVQIIIYVSKYYVILSFIVHHLNLIIYNYNITLIY